MTKQEINDAIDRIGTLPNVNSTTDYLLQQQVIATLGVAWQLANMNETQVLQLARMATGVNESASLR